MAGRGISGRGNKVNGQWARSSGWTTIPSLNCHFLRLMVMFVDVALGKYATPHPPLPATVKYHSRNEFSGLKNIGTKIIV